MFYICNVKQNKTTANIQKAVKQAKKSLTSQTGGGEVGGKAVSRKRDSGQGCKPTKDTP